MAGRNDLLGIPRGVDRQNEVWVSQGNGFGSTGTKIRRWTNVVRNLGSAITYFDDAVNGGTFTINEDGVYSIYYSDQFSTQQASGITLNSNQLSTSITSATTSTILAYTGNSSTASVGSAVSVTVFLNKGDIVRAHVSGGVSGSATQAEIFHITKISA